MIAREDCSAIEPDGGNSEEFGIPGQSESNTGDPGNDPSPFDPLLRHLSELQMLAGHYLRARADQISARLRTLLFWAAAGAVGLTIAAAFLATAVVLVLNGIATGLVLLGLQTWAADLLTGAVCIGAIATTIAIASFTLRSAARRKRRDDYKHFRARYRAKFGHGFDESGRNGK